MDVCFKSYRKKNGELMLYINNDRKVSIGVTEKDGFGLSKNITQGQRKLIDSALAVFHQNAFDFTGNLDLHKEEKVQCGPYTLVITDIAEIGGQNVQSDGAYIVRENKYLPCGQWFKEEESAD